MGEATATEALPQVTQPAVIVKRRGRPSDRAIQAYRRRVIEQEPEESIAKDLGVSGRRVRQLVRRVVLWSKQREAGDVLAIKIQHTQMLYELYRDARAQWKRSCEDATTHSIVTVDGLTTKDGRALPQKKTTRVSKRGQSGNPALMKAMDELLASIRGIWGADAPKQLEAKMSGQMTLAMLLSSSDPLPPEPVVPAGNVIDVDAEVAAAGGGDAS